MSSIVHREKIQSRIVLNVQPRLNFKGCAIDDTLSQ